MAGTIDIETGEYGSPSFVSLPFVRVDSGDDAGKWSASVRMLGVVEQEAPRLTGVISFTGGSPADIPIDSDLSGVLADIDVEDPTTPVVIEGEVVETPSETGFRAVIMDWNRVNRPGVVAER